MKHIETPERKVRGQIRPARALYILLALLLLLWSIAGYLATIPVVGEHPYWRTLRAQPRDFGVEAEDVSLTDGIRLTAWYLPAYPIARGTVRLAHGINANRSDMLPRAAFLAKAGYNTLLLDLRGHGESNIGKRPILFIAGQRDEICPPENARVMYDAALSVDKQLLIVPNADHDSTFKTAPQLYEATVLRFLGKVVP